MLWLLVIMSLTLEVKLGEFLDLVKFPVLSANVDVSKNKNLNGKIKPYIIKSVNGVKIALIGLSPENLPQLSMLDKNIMIKKEIDAAKKTVAKLKKKVLSI